MRLLYTDINYSLTQILVKHAQDYVELGSKVFYIAPNSLSFEKERTVLELLPQEASFDITVTRFVQMARYFTLDMKQETKSLSDAALVMVIYRSLMQLSEDDLTVYSQLRTDLTFVEQLKDLYKELKVSNLSIFDIVFENENKAKDLITIFSKIEELLQTESLSQESPLSTFTDHISQGYFDYQLDNTVVVIDGFTRFSAEEEALVAALNEKCKLVIVGTYISQKAYQKSFTEGNLYQASLEFLRDLSDHYQVKPEYVTSEFVYDESFQVLSELLEAETDFSQSDKVLPAQAKERIHIWQSLNQKEEIEHIAKAIRHKLYQGYRYKDILVLLGDVEAYQAQIGPIFDKYDIPYYLGRREAILHYPLVQFVESLERCRSYNWRREDLVNLLKSGLFGCFERDWIDQFEAYLEFADINGFTKFSRTFDINSGDGKGAFRFNLELINQVRDYCFSALSALFKSQKQKGQSLLDKLLHFLTTVDLPHNFQAMMEQQDENEQERDQEVWKTFVGILEDCHLVFANEKLGLDQVLSLLKIAMQSATYRAVPATLDVVTIKSYDLVEPHSKAFVMAIGMTQNHFPKHVKNTSLITDHEREVTNEEQDYFHRFDIASHENSKKNQFTALSLFNAATSDLLLSFPLVLNETSQEISPYLKTLSSFGIEIEEKIKNSLSRSELDIGNYKSLLSQLVDINRSELADELNEDDKNFWTVMLRYLKKRLASENLELPQAKNHLQTQTISDEVLALRYPKGQTMALSTSALTVFYDNQYKYFLQYVLGLQELQSIHPDARQHGTYLHQVFETIMADDRPVTFDQKVEDALEATRQDRQFKSYYTEDAQGRFSLQVLEDIAKSTASILKINQDLTVIGQEEAFELPINNQLTVTGKIDRIDQLVGNSIGIVDYKSSANKFDIGRFYNGLNSQLVTYLAALKAKAAAMSSKEQPMSLFGAMYLHLQDPKLDLKDFNQLDDKLVEKVYKDLTYKGIFLEDEKEKLSDGSYQTTNNLYSQEEVDQLLAYNQFLYEEAETLIRQGHFLINPYTEDGKSVRGDQLKAITRFESDLDMGQARHLVTLPTREKRQGFLTLMNKEVTSDDL
ncbi:ATP-dependent nuclease subunit B [Streptococcus hongkongensis]